jgi:hypothetical protein
VFRKAKGFHLLSGALGITMFFTHMIKLSGYDMKLTFSIIQPILQAPVFGALRHPAGFHSPR